MNQSTQTEMSSKLEVQRKRVRRLTNVEKLSFKLTPFLLEVLYGTMLGDGHMRKFSGTSRSNARVIFSQSLAQSDLINHYYDLFKSYSNTAPKINSSLIKETGNMRHYMSFATRSLPCFNELYSLFYLNKFKIIHNNLGKLITNISLAYWIMGDGSWTGSGVRLYTNNFTEKEVLILISVLETKFNLNPSKQKTKHPNKFIIYIPSKDMPQLRSFVLPFILPSFKRKLGLK